MPAKLSDHCLPATRRLLEIAITEEAVSQEEERLFTLETGDALFLFDDDIAKYLKEEMIGHVDGLIAARSALKTASRAHCE